MGPELAAHPSVYACLLTGEVGAWEAGSHRWARDNTWCGSTSAPCSPHRCSNLGHHPRPLHSAQACWSTRHPHGCPHWRPAPTASLMSCGPLEPSSPTTARFPPSLTSVLVVRAVWGQWSCWGTWRGSPVALGLSQVSPHCGWMLGLFQFSTQESCGCSPHTWPCQ